MGASNLVCRAGDRRGFSQISELSGSIGAPAVLRRASRFGRCVRGQLVACAGMLAASTSSKNAPTSASRKQQLNPLVEGSRPGAGRTPAAARHASGSSSRRRARFRRNLASRRTAASFRHCATAGSGLRGRPGRFLRGALRSDASTGKKRTRVRMIGTNDTYGQAAQAARVTIFREENRTRNPRSPDIRGPAPAAGQAIRPPPVRGISSSADSRRCVRRARENSGRASRIPRRVRPGRDRATGGRGAGTHAR